MKELVLVQFKGGCQRLTPIVLERRVLSRCPGTKRSEFRKAVQTLVQAGVLIYTSQCGISHLELNFNRPVYISPRILLSPGPHPEPADARQSLVRIEPGAAFGAGDHPTTRLALQGVDFAVSQLAETSERAKALDIGTGSGILGIAAAKLGVAEAVGVDTDPLACYEALKNVRLNNLEERMIITNDPLDAFLQKGARFELIIANLRPPTLKRLNSAMRSLTKTGGIWVLSGFKHEQGDRVQIGLGKQMKPIWENHFQGWAAMALQNNFK